MPKTVTGEKPQITYKPPQSVMMFVAEADMDYMVSCPVCEKRTMDVSELPDQLIALRYKCPHCRNIVRSPLVATQY